MIKKVFKTKIFERIHKRDNVFRVSFHDPSFGKFLQKHCGKDAYTKKIPEFILGHTDENLLIEFLKGYLRSDGAIAQEKGRIRGVQFTTVSKTLALQIQQIFARLGSLVTIKLKKGGIAVFRGKEYDCADSYHITCYNDYVCEKLGIKTNKSRKVVWEFIHDNKIWTKIRSIKKEKYSGDVYNCEVPGPHTYTVNNCIVHNCMQLLWGGKLNGKKISDHVSFVVATNRKEDKAAVTGMIEPLKNRATIVHLDTDVDDWCEWAIENKQPPEIVAFNRFRQNFLTNGYKPTTDFTNSATPRTIAKCGDMLKAGIPKKIEYEVYEGTAGKAFAVDFINFLEHFRRIPNIDNIIKNPDTAKVPTNDSILYATCECIAAQATRKNFDNILKYGERLNEEFLMMLVRDSVAHNEDVCNTTGFIEFQEKYQDVLVFTKIKGN